MSYSSAEAISEVRLELLVVFPTELRTEIPVVRMSVLVVPVSTVTVTVGIDLIVTGKRTKAFLAVEFMLLIAKSHDVVPVAK